MATLFCVGEIPPALLVGLSAEAFKERETAQAELLEWARKRPADGPASVLQISKTTEDPELRGRAVAVLRSLSDEDYLSDGSGYLGINMQEELLGQNDGERLRIGIRILGIMGNAPAARAGLQRGDLILGMDGATWHDLGATTEFSDQISRKKPRTEVLLLVQRGADEPEEMKVTLGRRPIEDLRQARESLQALDEQARARHFQEWIKRQELKLE